MPSASQNTNAMTFPADGTDPVFFGTEQPASVHCFDCCLDSGVMVNRSFIHCTRNKSAHKISFIFVKTLQALFRHFHLSAFWICCEQARHQSCAKLFHIQSLMQNISYTFFWNAYSLDLCTFICQSSNTISCTCSMISGVVALFGRPSRGSSSRLPWP